MESNSQQRGTRRRRATRNVIRRQTIVDGVVVEEPFTFTLPSTENEMQLGSVQGMMDNEGKMVGDGCYVSCVINNRKFYGVLVDQLALKKASELHFANEAASLALNRRMMNLYVHREGNNEKSLKEKRNISIDMNPIKEKKQKQEKTGQTFISGKTESETIDLESETFQAKTALNLQGKKETKAENKQVQKFEYIAPTGLEHGGPGYRKLLATYSDVIAASEGIESKKSRIYSACQSGGEFVDGYYYQYQVLENTLLSKRAVNTEDSMIGFRTSISFNSFLHNTLLPPWYPLKNLPMDQSKILNMLQMKRNNKGGVQWDDKGTFNSNTVAPSSFIASQAAPSIKPRNCFRIGVLGGGIAGLACSLELLRRSRGEEKLEIEVTLLEGRSRVGGRLITDNETFKYDDGKPFPVDLGASWIHGIDKNPLTELAKEAGVQFVRASEEVKMLTSNMREVDKDCDKRMSKLFDDLLDKGAEDCWNKDEYSYEHGRYQKSIRWFGTKLPIDNFSTSPSSTKPDKTDVPEYRYTSDISVDRAIGLALKTKKESVQLSQQDLNLLHWNTKNTEYALGANISDLSMRFWDADERHAFQGDHVLLKQGYSEIVDHLYSQCKQYTTFKDILDFPIGRVEYARPSELLAYPNRKRRQKATVDLSDSCCVYSKDGKNCHYFDFIVSALPLGVLKDSTDAKPNDVGKKNSEKVLFYPALPASKRDAIDAVGFGLLNKVYLQFPTAFWRKPGNREFLRGSPFLGLEQDVFGNASGFNAHHYMFLDVGRSLCGDDKNNAVPILLTLISGVEAVASESVSESALVADVMETLRHLYSGIDVPEPTTVKRTMWGSDEFSRGSYTYLPPGATDEDYQTLQKAVNGHGDFATADETMRLFWAGEHTTSLHPSVAHGALLSGIRAAGEVFSSIDKKKVGGEDASKIDHLIPIPLYRSKHPSDPVSCNLCHIRGSRKREGALCAFQRGKQQVIVHDNCASYSPEVGVFKGVWKNVIKATIRGKQLTCVLCKKVGATIGCNYSQCFRSFHLGCCEDTGWNFGRYGKYFLCDLHRSNHVAQKDDNLISIPFYRSKNFSYSKLACFLCGGSEDANVEGKLIGIQRGNQQIVLHSNCIRYSSNVDCWDDSLYYKNVFEAIRLAKICTKCNKAGASVKCSYGSCNLHYHFKCAVEEGWNFESENSNFTCRSHGKNNYSMRSRGSELVGPRTTSTSIFQSNHLSNDNKAGFIGHDLFCSGAKTFLVDNDPCMIKPQVASENSHSNKKNATGTTYLNLNTNDDDGHDEGADNNHESAEGDGSTDEDGDDSLSQKLVIDPQVQDGEIGRRYAQRIEINATRNSIDDPWFIIFALDRSTAKRTVTLKIDTLDDGGKFVPFGLKKGDMVISINGTKIGSEPLSTVRKILELMKNSLHLRISVLRSSSVDATASVSGD